MFGMQEHVIWMDPFPGKVLPFLTVDTKKIVEWKSPLILLIAYYTRLRFLLVLFRVGVKYKTSILGG